MVCSLGGLQFKVAWDVRVVDNYAEIESRTYQRASRFQQNQRQTHDSIIDRHVALSRRNADLTERYPALDLP